MPLTLVSNGYWFYSGIWNFLILLEEGFMFMGKRKWLMNGDEWTMNEFALANLWTALLTIFLKMLRDHSKVGIAWGWSVRIKTWKWCLCGQTSMQMDNAWKHDGGDLERKPLTFFWMAALKGSHGKEPADTWGLPLYTQNILHFEICSLLPNPLCVVKKQDVSLFLLLPFPFCHPTLISFPFSLEDAPVSYPN